MLRYTLQRIIQLIPTIFGIYTLVFLLMRVLPGDPAQFLAGSHDDAETIANLRLQLHLDEPILEQYVGFLNDLAARRPGQELHFAPPRHANDGGRAAQHGGTGPHSDGVRGWRGRSARDHRGDAPEFGLGLGFAPDRADGSIDPGFLARFAIADCVRLAAQAIADQRIGFRQSSGAARRLRRAGDAGAADAHDAIQSAGRAQSGLHSHCLQQRLVRPARQCAPRAEQRPAADYHGVGNEHRRAAERDAAGRGDF